MRYQREAKHDNELDGRNISMIVAGARLPSTANGDEDFVARAILGPGAESLA